MTLDSSVRDLLDGYLRDLLMAYEGLRQATKNHEADVDLAIHLDMLSALNDIDDAIGLMVCSECWGAGRTPYRIGFYHGDGFTRLCEPCAAKGPKPDPFGGVTTSRSDE